MDLLFGAAFITLGVVGLFMLAEASDYREIGERKGWMICLFLSVFSLMALIVTLRVCEQQVVKSYQVTDTFGWNDTERVKFNRPVGIKKRHTDYAWCFFRTSTTYQIDVDAGCK